MGARHVTDVRIDPIHGEPVLVLAGDLDVRSTGRLRTAVREHIQRCGIDLISPVVIDVTDVSSIDATALKVIAAASREAQRYGVRVVLRGARPAVRRMLHLTHLIRLVELEREPIPA
jgi:anti-anti-sigma factor